MRTILRSAVIALALSASASGAMAQRYHGNAHHPHYGNQDNLSETERAWKFWDAQQDQGN